jgi:transposase
MKLHVLGIDLGKTVFHLVGLDSTGRLVIRKRCSRRQLLAFTANLEVQLIGMEACSGAHFLGRALREQGHEVRLMPAQYVKPYVQTNKSDYLDAEAIAEAVQRPRMRFVPIKTEEQLDLQALHRVRERWVMRRTAVVNQIRSLLLERGLTLSKGRRHLDEQLPRILEDAELNLSGSFVFCWLSSNWNWSNSQHALRRWIGSSRKWRKRMKPANDSRRFPESVRLPRPP